MGGSEGLVSEQVVCLTECRRRRQSALCPAERLGTLFARLLHTRSSWAEAEAA